MGKYSFRICAGLISFFIIYSITLVADNTSQFQNAELRSFITPEYNEETKKLEYILTGKNAETVGTLVKIDDARLEVMGKDGETIDTVITTPEAFYDRVAGYVKGDKDVHYRSLKMDGDGVGFRLNNINKTLYINKNVKLIIYPDENLRVEKATESKIEADDDEDTALNSNSEIVKDNENLFDSLKVANEELIELKEVK